MIHCDFLTGFLGSGKTTLLNHFLKNVDQSGYAIIVNEFGIIGLDQLVYQEITDNVFLLDSGCLCCTMTHSFRETLLQIQSVILHNNLKPLQKVIVESSGLADPAPILHSLLGDKVLAPYFQLGAVVTVVDAMHGEHQISNYPESMRQILAADHIVISKNDLVDESQLQAITAMVQSCNPYAPICLQSDQQAVDHIFQGLGNSSFHFVKLLQPTARGISSKSQLLTTRNYSKLPSLHSANAQSWSAFIDTMPTWVGLSAWWYLVSNQFESNLLRCKGILQLDNPQQYVMIHGVGTYFHPPSYLEKWPDSDSRGRLVCIGIDLNIQFLNDSLKALTLKDSFAKPKNLKELQQLME